MNGDWECSYPVSGTGVMTVNFFSKTGEVDPDGDGEQLVGFRINESEMKEWKVPYGAPSGNSDLDPVKIKAQCWDGSVSDRPNDLSQVTNTSVTYTGGDLNVAMEIPVRGGSQQYGCIWGFQQHIIHNIGKPGLRMEGATQNEVNYFFSGVPTKYDPINTEVSENQIEIKHSKLKQYKPNNLANAQKLNKGTDPWKQFPYPSFNYENRRNPEECYLDSECN